VGNGSVGLSVRTTSGDVRLKILGGLVSTATGTPAVPQVPVIPQAPAAPSTPAAPVAPMAPSVPEPIPLGAPVMASDPHPIGDDDTQAWNAPEPVIDRREADRLGVLRALERGDMDVETASRRLEALDEAGPRSFQGWC